MSDESQLVDIGGLWVNESKDGRKYFKGKLNGADLIIFKNDRREEGTNQPQYKMYVARPRPKQKEREPGEEG